MCQIYGFDAMSSFTVVATGLVTGGHHSGSQLLVFNTFALSEKTALNILHCIFH